MYAAYSIRCKKRDTCKRPFLQPLKCVHLKQFVGPKAILKVYPHLPLGKSLRKNWLLAQLLQVLLEKSQAYIFGLATTNVTRKKLKWFEAL